MFLPGIQLAVIPIQTKPRRGKGRGISSDARQMRFETELAGLTVHKIVLEMELADLHVRKESAEFNAAEIRTATLYLAGMENGGRPISTRPGESTGHRSQRVGGRQVRLDAAADRPRLSARQTPPHSPHSPLSSAILPAQLGISKISTMLQFFASQAGLNPSSGTRTRTQETPDERRNIGGTQTQETTTIWLS